MINLTKKKKVTINKTPQIPMDWGHTPSFDSADFLTLDCNAEAVAQLERWPNWGLHTMALVGPEGAGKTHLARAWAERAGAVAFVPDSDLASLPEGICLFVDDADSGEISDDTLFHLYNWTKETGGSLLLTGQRAPNLWGNKLPDLASRLATLPVATIGVPDEIMLTTVLLKHFSDRQLNIKSNVLHYIILHMPRSFSAARAIVERLDHFTLASKRKMTIPVVKEILSGLEGFDDE